MRLNNRVHRWTTTTAMLATVVVASSCGTSQTVASSEATGEFDWRRFEGSSIELLLNQHPWQQAIEPRLGDFEALTGIDVAVNTLPEDQFRQRVQVMLSARSSETDVFMTSSLVEGRLFAENGWYEDLTHYIDNPSLTSSEYDWDDFVDGVVENSVYDGLVGSVPIQIETTMLFYRTDVLAELGLEVPRTRGELRDVAAAVTAAGELHGFTGRGRGAAATSQFSPFLFGAGAEWNTTDGAAAFDSEAGIDAFRFYGELLREYGPVGAVNNSWQEVLPLFQQGTVAMIADASVFATQLLDPMQSAVAEHVGFSLVPGGDEPGSVQGLHGWDLALNPFSEAKGPAWLFMQWATSPQVVAELQSVDGIAGGRASATEFPPSVPQEWIDVFTEARAIAVSEHPGIVNVPEARDIIGNAVVVAIQGGDVEAAVREAAVGFDALSD